MERLGIIVMKDKATSKNGFITNVQYVYDSYGNATKILNSAAIYFDYNEPVIFHPYHRPFSR